MSEFLLHKAVTQLLRLNAVPNCVWYSIPNGERRSPRTGAKLKSMGVIPGAPDFAFVLPDGRAAFLELKWGKNQLTADQRAFRAAVERAGGLFEVAWSTATADAILYLWGVIGRQRIGRAA